jgi:hypothetical protein
MARTDWRPTKHAPRCFVCAEPIFPGETKVAFKAGPAHSNPCARNYMLGHGAGIA